MSLDSVRSLFDKTIGEREKEREREGPNFINVLLTAFTLVAPKSVRIQSNPQYLFTLLGSTCAKAVHRTLVKLTQGDGGKEGVKT
jgi:hypothetical protein